MKFIILKIAWHYCYIGEQIRRKNLWQKFYINGMKLLCTWILMLDCNLRKYFRCRIEPLDDNKNLPIVSFTSFPARIKSVWYVIDSIFYQTMRPKKIILVLAKDEFPEMLDSIPKSIKRYLDKGLEIMFVDDNLRPHKKYFYTLPLYRNDDIITIDDDVYYWPDTIERLYKIKKNNPGCICANRAFLLEKENDGLRFSEVSSKIGLYLWAQGVGGTLYIPEFRNEQLFDKEKIKQMCLNADDNWLKVHEILTGINVATNGFYPHPISLPGSQKKALWHDNAYKGQSFVITELLLAHYNINIK